MRYCVPMFKNFKYLNKVDEVTIPFDKSLEVFKTLLEKEKILPTHRVIVEVADSKSFQEDGIINVFLNLKENHPDIHFTLMFAKYDNNQAEFFQELKTKEIEFFFSTYARDWDTFHGLINLGVSDIYIVENLGFELDLLGPIAHASDVSIRVFANVCQSSWLKDGTFKSFFIRPEDVIVYDEYVDVIEFIGDKTVQEVMYKVYAIDQKWHGSLKQIIVGLEEDIDSHRIPQAFAAARIGCGKRCSKGKRCKICERIMETSDVMREHNMYFKIRKNNPVEEE